MSMADEQAEKKAREAERKRQYYQANKEILKRRAHQWQVENRERYNEYQRHYQRQQRASKKQGDNTAPAPPFNPPALLPGGEVE
jgi:hypothetical protein